jgi:hypothetical protein
MVNEYDAGSGTQIPGARVPQQQNSSSHGGNHDDSIETKQQPAAPLLLYK